MNIIIFEEKKSLYRLYVEKIIDIVMTIWLL
jgi:hypothetical protein